MNNLISNSFISYKQNQLDNLNKVENILNNIPDFKSIDVNLNMDLSEFNQTNVLYYFEVINNNDILQEICNVISENKKNENKIKFPKVNEQNISENDNILYVGKSKGKFSNRLNQHLGNASEKTYSLHLNKLNELLNSQLNLKLHYTSLSDISEIKDNEDLLEIIESSLHSILKPILGRQGH